MRASGWACAQGRAAHGEWHTSHGAPRRQGDEEEERNARSPCQKNFAVKRPACHDCTLSAWSPQKGGGGDVAQVSRMRCTRKGKSDMR